MNVEIQATTGTGSGVFERFADPRFEAVADIATIGGWAALADDRLLEEVEARMTLSEIRSFLELAADVHGELISRAAAVQRLMGAVAKIVAIAAKGAASVDTVEREEVDR